MKTRRKLISLLSAAAVVAAGTGLIVGSANADPGSDRNPGEQVAWKVPGLTGKQATSLEDDGFDLVDYEDDGSAIVIGDEKVADKLRDKGMKPKFLDTIVKPVDKDYKDTADTYYGGYHTVTAHEEHLDKVASEHSDLAKVYDIGDSWLKTKGEGGHDIKAICITKIADGDCEQKPDSKKPRFSMIAQMHAREIATGEVAWKFIDKLTTGYGQDDAVTKLLDSTEVWVVPIANPDGVDIVASGGDNPILQRKNANDSAGDCGESKGVDLNRNSSFKWGDDSDDPCAETYQGTAAKSEPETAGLEEWFQNIHPDQREDDPSSPAPNDARDTMITLHSYGQYIIIPWGFTEDQSPNDAQLRALGEKMSESNGYKVGTNGDTVGYSTSGTTDDFTYGQLGVASFTFEMGADSGDCGGFLPVYECVDSTLWKENEGALMTAAEAAKAPYAE
ncbi:M14 family zinc carboxypeptidase [Stackebrandtia nassauensis]|uniref:Peptidase M14 carboxypeptidase A n=1 Tax=Stackebrandtia nassauensis (strain DSM 44728 / CIP 108903 / NRRL B-16338 / NBRC 102104 / LLR-40K-21) TaxID=446470 RepID=D3Q4E8_STANL|nr:M14 family zinc carboxypeptidase [Stackebrandtia nassauensis]ADD40108.1 peptidase M14 carboxypeptidase A [Stackebrandtia nassauensis DSM 44728]